MVYKNNFVAVIKVNGKILREVGEFVVLPFGAEYSILLKNLDSRKAVASITIDGIDVMGGDSVIVPANESVEVEGFVDGLRATNRFKFIKKTEEISDHRGDKVDDGVIRVEYKFEKQIEKRTIIHEVDHEHHHHHYDHHHYRTTDYYPYWSPYRSFSAQVGSSIKEDISGIKFTSSATGGGSGGATEKKGLSIESVNAFHSSVGDSSNILTDAMNATLCSSRVDVAEDGITVKGSESNQSFITGWTNELEETSQVICIRLKGKVKVDNKVVEVKKPITVQTKVQCDSCGRTFKSGTKFCSNCGTALMTF